MSRLRLVLACLLMAALPLQGWAAVTMAFCGDLHRTAAAVVAEAGHSAGHAMEHAAPHGHDHAAPHAHADTDHQHDGHSTPSKTSTSGADHKCPACGACCHGAGLAAFDPLPVVAPPARVDAIEPVVQLHAPSLRQPDKPPRA